MRNVKNRSMNCLVESLENRALFTAVGTGTINGIVFNDINSNTTVDPGELPITPVSVYVDQAPLGMYDPNDTLFSTTTDVNGNFSLTNLPAGTHQVRVVLGEGQSITTLPSDINLGDGQTISGVLIGLHSAAATGSITGTIFGDANTNGIYDAGDSVGASKTVFLDLNSNNTLDLGETSTTSNGSGVYTFSNLPAGTYHVRRVFPSGWIQSSAPIDVNLLAGQNLTGQNIGSKQGSNPPPVTTGSISGILFWDSNNNGTYNSGEVLQSGKTVYIDSNNNGNKDAGEKSAVTNGSGAYSFTGLSAGTYRVRRVLPSGVGITSSPYPIVINLAAGQVVTGKNIGSQFK